MAKFIFHFDAFDEEAKDVIRRGVRKELLKQGFIKPRKENETKAEFEHRVCDEVEDYIALHDFGGEYVIEINKRLR